LSQRRACLPGARRRLDRGSVRRTLLIAATLIAVMPTTPWRTLRAQSVDSNASGTRDAMVRVARDIMRAARFCALVTRDATTGSSARTIDPAPPDSAMVVRFVTNPRSRKVKQLAVDPRVALYYFDASAQRYATLYGRARAIRDPAEKARRWYEGWTPFYPQRERDATLYEVVPERIELVSPGDSVVGDAVSWATPTIRFPARRTRR